jgi:hypothetical protein
MGMDDLLAHLQKARGRFFGPLRRTLSRTMLCSLLVSSCALPRPDEAQPYEGCEMSNTELTCDDGVTICLGLAQNPGVGICSMACVNDVDCATNASARQHCERFTTGAFCVLSCERDEDCAINTECTKRNRIDGTSVRLCEAS